MLVTWITTITGPDLFASGQGDQGKESYNYYCYQCHGYAGNGQTLAARFLDPAPRNFTNSDPDLLHRDQMLRAVREGIAGSGMVSFSRVLSEHDIAQVVDFIRTAFMTNTGLVQQYHTAENGWEDHNRYSIAFPFATGEIPLDTGWDALSREQQRGKRLFLKACISCHDRARVTDPAGQWRLHAVSFPRSGKYDPDFKVDAYTGASTYLKHEVMPRINALEEEEQEGQRLFQENCAFCHGADGTGKNWIGSFMQPPAADLTNLSAVETLSAQELAKIIETGLPNTSMPAWGDVLEEGQIHALARYLKRAFSNDRSGTPPNAIQPENTKLRWERK